MSKLNWAFLGVIAALAIALCFSLYEQTYFKNTILSESGGLEFFSSTFPQRPNDAVRFSYKCDSGKSGKGSYVVNFTHNPDTVSVGKIVSTDADLFILNESKIVKGKYKVFAHTRNDTCDIKAHLS